MDHSSHANFVMAVSSHGTRRTQSKRQQHEHLSKDMMCDSILGVNEKSVDLFTLISHFKEDECPTLKGKPKLFFIQVSQLIAGFQQYTLRLLLLLTHRGRHFANDIFKLISLHENWLKFYWNSPLIDYMSALVQIMDWCQSASDRTLSEVMLV